MRILLTAATEMEIQPTINWLRAGPRAPKEVVVVTSGVGLTTTALTLGRHLGATTAPYDLALQAGIGGTLDKKLPPGTLVQITKDTIADQGARDKDGSFLSMQTIGFPPPPPFGKNGWLETEAHPGLAHLPTATGVSVNTVNGYAPAIEEFRSRYPTAQVESMEGAAFLLACQTVKIPAVQLRAISNYVAPRDRENWKIGLAIRRLNEELIAFLDGI